MGFTYIAGLLKMASSAIMTSPGFLRLLSSRTAYGTIPIWNCRSNENFYNSSPLSILTMSAQPKPVSMSPFLGVRLCSSSSIREPSKAKVEIIPPKKLEVVIEIIQGLPHLTVPLPSRNEPCIFVLKPVTHTIGDLLAMLKTEDPGIDRVVIRSIDGIRIASTTSIQTLMQSDFDLVINDVTFRVATPPFQSSSTSSLVVDDEMKRMGDVRALVGQLYEALHIEEYQAQQEQRLVRELEAMKDDLVPLEESKKILDLQAEKRTNNLTWLGLGLMSVQFGILARLTWWEYSWDIMEPVTYFVTYGTAMACYAYFVLTRQDYLLPDVRDRQQLITFHKNARKNEWDVHKYNSLKDGIARVELELGKLRDNTKLRPSNEALRKAAQELEKNNNILLGSHINFGNIKELLRGKIQDMKF